MRENYEYYFTVPRTFVQDFRNLRYARISMVCSNGSWESIEQYHMTVWRAQILTHGADSIFCDLRWSSVISFQPIASYYLSQERNFKTIRDKLKKPAVTSKGPLKWETFQKKGNNETEKGKPDFYKSRTVNWLNRRVVSWINWKWKINQLLNPSTFAKSLTIFLLISALL